MRVHVGVLAVELGDGQQASSAAISLPAAKSPHSPVRTASLRTATHWHQAKTIRRARAMAKIAGGRSC